MSTSSKFYFETIVSVLRRIEEEQQESINTAAAILAKAVTEDKLINVIGPGDTRI